MPDMKADIWKRIEFQLDIDLPNDEGIHDPQAPMFPKPGQAIMGAVSIVFLTALLLYSVFKKKEHTTHQRKPDSITAPLIVPKQKDGVLIPSNIERREVPVPKKAVPSQHVHADSNNFSEPVVPPGIIRSLNEDRGDVIIIPPVESGKEVEKSIPKLHEMKQKKKRGVQGLTDDDYRIEANKKDSLP
ncbi:MAG TPA: hypothetical protein VJ499_15585 [Flavisolibacter sp.]|nr:hypothetical protein [Flavisolibacter sp.]